MFPPHREHVHGIAAAYVDDVLRAGKILEIASGCDPILVGKEFPNLTMLHGIDKRILAHSKEAIDAELERIIPVMKARGGYIPACDHGVPEEVSLENYLHYRKRMIEMGG